MRLTAGCGDRPLGWNCEPKTPRPFTTPELLDLSLYRSDVEAYKVALSMDTPSAFVIMDEDETGDSPGGWQVTDVTLSPTRHKICWIAVLVWSSPSRSHRSSLAGLSSLSIITLKKSRLRNVRGTDSMLSRLTMGSETPGLVR